MKYQSLHSLVLFFSVWISGLYLVQAQQKIIISGYVKEKGSGELLPGASVYIQQLKQGTVTNNYGFFSVTVPMADSVDLTFSYVGYQTTSLRFSAAVNQTINVELAGRMELVKAEVTATRIERVSKTSRMSMIELPVQQIKDAPAFLGEKDVLKVLQLMPGMQRGSEGSSGLYVRGGGADQNLIILDEAPVYNAFHLFGFFSLFNGDALKSVELSKGGFPARYGGRLSSVVDLTMKDGNKEEVHGEGGVGLISARLTVEGPVKKGKSSYLVSARRTYVDVLLFPLIYASNDGAVSAGYYFFDLNAKLNFNLNDRDKLYVSGYFGKDKFYGRDDSDGNFKFRLGWGNATGTFRWNHLFNPKLFSNMSLIVSNYRFEIKQEEENGGYNYFLNYYTGIRDLSLKYDFDYRPTNNHLIKAGIISTWHHYTPRALVEQESEFGIDTKDIDGIDAVENALYVEDDLTVLSIVRINAGIRLSQFYSNNQNYFNAEPRLSAGVSVTEFTAVKASYAIMNQYTHQLSNSGIGLPTDLWVPSTDLVLPQRSQQFAAGLARDFIKQNITVSLEGYYKLMDRVIAYKEGASFFDTGNPSDPGSSDDGTSFENKVTQGNGRSYGAEILIQRKEGRITGWVGYTLSWTYLNFDDLNYGNDFFARYDSRHNISITGSYKLRESIPEKNGITFSATWVYGTGNAVTLPVGEFAPPIDVQGSYNNQTYWPGFNYDYVSEYTDRNAYRMAPYHRLDIGVQFIKKKKKYIRTWDVGVYNAYNRYNPYFYYIDTNDNGVSVLKQFSLFPILPSVSYNFKF